MFHAQNAFYINQEDNNILYFKINSTMSFSAEFSSTQQRRGGRAARVINVNLETVQSRTWPGLTDEFTFGAPGAWHVAKGNGRTVTASVLRGFCTLRCGHPSHKKKHKHTKRKHTDATQCINGCWVGYAFSILSIVCTYTLYVHIYI